MAQKQPPDDGRGFNFDVEEPIEQRSVRERAAAEEPGKGVRDEHYEEATEKGPDSDLASMYVRGKPKGDARLTLKEGLPPAEPRSHRGLTLLLLFLVLVGSVAAFLFTGDIAIVQPDYTRKTVNRLQYYREIAAMGAAQARLQNLDPQYVDYLLTSRRLDLVHAAVGEFIVKRHRPPNNPLELVAAKLLTDADLKDAWGTDFVLSTFRDQVEIRSKGADKLDNSSDDAYYQGDKLVLPASVQQKEMEEGAAAP